MITGTGFELVRAETKILCLPVTLISGLHSGHRQLKQSINLLLCSKTDADDPICQGLIFRNSLVKPFKHGRGIV